MAKLTAIDAAYDEAWDAEEEPKRISAEERELKEARNQLAREAMMLVNESIRDRNTSTFSDEIKRASKLYNACSIDASDDLLHDWEGSRKAVKDGSKVVQNIVRQLTDDGASQLGDMLYPTDQDNYGIVPIYPARPPVRLKNEVAVDETGSPLVDPEGNQITHQQAWEARKVELEAKCVRMREIVSANLERVRFGRLGRRLIHDAARTGTAILKGPYVNHAGSKHWAVKGENWTLMNKHGHKADFSVVNVLDFLPDMSAETKEDMAYASVRLWNLPRQLRQLKGSGKYYEDEIDALLSAAPRKIGESATEGATERLSLKDTALVEKLYDTRYEVFETHAEFQAGLLRKAGVKGIKESVKDHETILACVVHCESRCLKAYLNPLDSGEMPFSIWNWSKDPTCVLGKGIPILAENCQLIYNAVWRMILDHGGLSAVPMVSMMKDKVSPAGNNKSDYSLQAGKVWHINSDMFNLPDGARGRPFEIHEIPVALNQFFAIMEKAEEDAYKLTGVTRVEKNEIGVDNAPVTLGATQIYQNNASVSRRRQVRDFDDEITKETLTRLYDWLMQYEDDDAYKGPMEIEPRGSSVLMQREVNTQNLFQLYQLTAGGTTPGSKATAMLREIQSGMQFPDGRFVETIDEELSRAQMEAENPTVPPEVQIEQDKLMAQQESREADIEVQLMKIEIEKAEKDARLQLDMIDSERKHYREMIKIEAMTEASGNQALINLQSKADTVQQQLQVKLAEIQSKRDIAAGKLLQDEETNQKLADAKQLEAQAKAKDADTKASELSNKIAGTIERGI